MEFNGAPQTAPTSDYMLYRHVFFFFFFVTFPVMLAVF